MAAIHDELAGEGIEYFSDGALITKGRIGAGKFYVTKQRVVFLRANPALSLFGAIGGLISARVEPKKIGLEIPLADVTGVEQGKFGRSETLTIRYGADRSAKIAIKTYATAVKAMDLDADGRATAVPR